MTAITAILLLRFFQLEFGFVFVEKGAEIVGLVEQPGPLFEIERDRETSQAIDADAAFFTDAEFQRSGALGGNLLLQFSKTGFHFFICWFCHVGSSGLSYNKENQNLTTETRRHGENRENGATVYRDINRVRVYLSE